MNVYLYIIGALAAIIVGGSAFAVWFVVSENADRRKHYKVTLTDKEDGTMGVYRSKLEKMDHEPITIVPYSETQICNLDVRLLDGSVKVADLRVRK